MMLRKPTRDPFPWRVHPIWRGIGCLLLIILPVLAYGFTDLIIAWALANNETLARGVQANPALLTNPYFKGTFTLVLTVILYLVFSILGSIIYSLAGGPLNEEVATMTRGRYE
ncbi:MAG: hypothetical protein KF821_03145 [Anaerolineales bacterium]|jgi:hypothetical protein|nr:hypothetical protein [Anaerolineales bacterium]MCW5839236.1 hypothetical protein [Anaerolineales bacterium]MCW5888419.1 hypothetical protein [Anaerolineales bacterium]